MKMWGLLLPVLLSRPALASECGAEDGLDPGSYGFFQTCRASHVQQALQRNVVCRPGPVVVRLPLPNNTDIQQVLRENRSVLPVSFDVMKTCLLTAVILTPKVQCQQVHFSPI